MEYRVLGRTGIRISLMSYGTGGPSKFGQNTGLEYAQQERLIKSALDLGINFFDSSAQYGESEEILGRALGGVPRDSYALCTKWAHQRAGKLADDPSELAASVDQSLDRFRTDYLDVMLFHGLMQKQYRHVVDRLYPEMVRLKEAGKIRFVGFSEMFTQDPRHETVTEALRSDAQFWDVVMLKYGILNQWAAKEVFPLAIEHNVGVLNMAPVRLKMTRPCQLEETVAEWKRTGFIQPGDLPDNDPFGWLVRDGIESVIAAGYKFAADHPAVSSVLTGTSSEAHLKANVAALDHPRLPEADQKRLVALLGDSEEKS